MRVGLKQRVVANEVEVARDVEELVGELLRFFGTALLEHQVERDGLVDAVEHSVLVVAVGTKVGVSSDKDFFVLCRA